MQGKQSNKTTAVTSYGSPITHVVKLCLLNVASSNVGFLLGCGTTLVVIDGIALDNYNFAVNPR